MLSAGFQSNTVTTAVVTALQIVYSSPITHHVVFCKSPRSFQQFSFQQGTTDVHKNTGDKDDVILDTWIASNCHLSVRVMRLVRSSYSKLRYLWYFLLPLLLTAGLRNNGAVRQWDLFALDRLLSMRPLETMDNRIVIVTINEEDLQKEEGKDQGRVSEQSLANAINTLAAAGASVIGVDIFTDGKFNSPLTTAYQSNKNVIGLSRESEPDPVTSVLGLSPDRIGFSDYEPDADSLVRRAPLAIFDKSQPPQQEPKYSFAFQISRLYLQKHSKKIQISPQRLELGVHSVYPFETFDDQQDPEQSVENDTDLEAKAITTGQIEYFDIIVNYRHVYPTFTPVTLTDVLAKKLPNIQNKIVIIGSIETAKQDFVNTSVFPISSKKITSNLSGVEYHANIVSQLISTTLDGRASIQQLPFWGDYLWILACMISSGLIFRFIKFKTPFWQLPAVVSIYITSVCFSIYFIFMIGWWLPIGLTSIILITNIPMLLSLYQREQSLMAIAEKRRQAISETFNAIHNGPLQELSLLLQSVKSGNISLLEVGGRLERLNQQIRHIGESLQTDTTQELQVQEMLVLGNGDRLDLNMPLNELFHLVADRTLNNDAYPNLKNLKVKVIDFQEVPTENKLSLDNKRSLCQFLEESIGNVGKYAEGAVRLQLLGRVDGDIYRLSIIDNGHGKFSKRVGQGTKQAQHLAAQLNGKFDRSQNHQGVSCSIEWHLNTKS